MIRVSRRGLLSCVLAAPVLLRAAQAQAATQHLTIKGMAFAPARLALAKGDHLIVTNDDAMPHSCTADDGQFDTGRLAKGQSAELTLTAAGEFSFHCSVHPAMRGVITVPLGRRSCT